MTRRVAVVGARQLRIGSLFSGIGGIGLGLEWALASAGIESRVMWQVERSDYCRRVLARHWPDTDRSVTDVRSATAGTLAGVDLIEGGFPCQNLSSANVRTGTGLDGEQSGLWSEFRRVVSEFLPRFAIIENVASAWREWVPVVRRDLGRLGYASVPLRVSTVDVGGPFDGARVFVVAAADGDGESTRAIHAQVARLPELASACRKDWGHPSPRALGVADGIPNRLERLGAVGNAASPASVEVAGRVVAALASGRARGTGGG